MVIIVLDQARPDTIDRYGMKNVQKLQQKGKSFPNALVGHMAAETVISHNVLTSGLFPKNMGWSNEVYRDVDNVLGAPGAYHVTSSMSCAQFKALIAHGNYDKLQDYLDTRFGETSKFASIAQKRTSACTSGHTRSTDLEDIIFQIRGSSSTSCDPSQPTQSGWRSPEYANGTPPAYFGLAACSRWSTWQAAGAYGTGSILPAAIYPLDGNRFVPGFDPAHIGGDTWSADAAIRVIQNDPDWHGMMVSLGAIDKMGHMWGPEDNVTGPRGSDRQVSHLPFAAKNADEQVGQDRRRSQAIGGCSTTPSSSSPPITPRRPGATSTAASTWTRAMRRPGRTPTASARTATGTTDRTPTSATSIRARPSRSYGTGWPATWRSRTRTAMWRRG